MKTSEFLRQAKAVIDTPEKWTKSAHARLNDYHKSPVNPSDVNAVCWCASGAVDKTRWAVQPTMPITDGTNLQLRAWAFLETVARKLGFSDHVRMNDHRLTTHDEVMGLFDDATVLAEREGD